jgi:peptidyl-tRNA hydrolase
MKQVLVVNGALGLPPGKLAAQVAHAAVAAFLSADTLAQRRWIEVGMPKIVVRAADEADLLALEAHAQRLGLPTATIYDAGKTVVPAGTLTCIGIGPGDTAVVDSITGALPLL